ncbi:MAG: HAMP domain-containing histidine kinase [Verrucomicrobia bacterium]|nr:HAMP domain-containing histidine kinase [Verrucomicrobiota bacterium]
MNRLQAGSSPQADARPSRVAGFRTKLLVAMMLVVTGVTALALSLAERNLVAGAERDLERDFAAELSARQRAAAIRHAALAERCRALVRRPRIQAALEEFREALYDNAEDELRDITESAAEPAAPRTTPILRARFYRFLDQTGAVIPPAKPKNLPSAGELDPADTAKLALPGLPAEQQLGYLAPRDGAVVELIAMPIVSLDNGEVISALILGSKPVEFTTGPATAGLWFGGRLYLTSPHAGTLAPEVERMLAADREAGPPRRISLAGEAHLLFAKRLNPGSRFPPAYEVCVYSLAGLNARQWQLRWQVVGSGAGLLLVGLLASQFLSRRLSAPVEQLAVDSERSARFSADASHQLKTPVTVLRAGLEELMTRENLTPEECAEISALIHQTYRLSSLIEDLLLLSRMDAGRLKLDLTAVNLTQLIEASLDDLSALPDDHEIAVETAFPAGLLIAGEKRYTAIILQNLLENARKYNRPGGSIRLAARAEHGAVFLSIANTGGPISSAAQAHIFERFHRGAIGENVPGYGLGLNLARELARLHQGDLRLVRSDDSWTEFEVRFRPAP